jgi:hypothetical protein
MEMLEALELDRALQIGRDTSMRDGVRLALHVALKAWTVAPAAHHYELIRVSVRPPDLEIDEALRGLDEMRPPTERVDEVVSPLRGDAET